MAEGWNKSSRWIELTMSHQLDENKSTDSHGITATELLRAIASKYDRDWEYIYILKLVIFKDYGKGDI